MQAHGLPEMPVTSCRRGCGRCCDPVILTRAMADRIAASLADGTATDSALFIAEHWTRRPDGAELDRMPGSSDATLWDCDQYDPATGDCLAHERKPPVCADFPWYGQGPADQSRWLEMVCTFHADLGRRVLPLQVLSSHRSC